MDFTYSSSPKPGQSESDSDMEDTPILTNKNSNSNQTSNNNTNNSNHQNQMNGKSINGNSRNGQSSFFFDVSFLSKKRDRGEQQDAYFVTTQSDRLVEVPAWGVFDGHGTMGATASKLAAKSVQMLCKTHLKRTMNAQEIALKLNEIFIEANKQLLDVAAKGPQNTCDYGTTAIVMCLVQANANSPAMLVVANVGDSRAILCRKSSETQMDMFDLSKDHKLSRKDELERVKAAGATVHMELMGGRLSASTKDYTLDQLKQMKLGLNMTRAFGHIILQKYGVSPKPEFSFMPIQSGDVLISATDGLWEVVTNDNDVSDRVFIHSNCERLSKDLCKLSDNRFLERKIAADNITIVVVHLQTVI